MSDDTTATPDDTAGALTAPEGTPSPEAPGVLEVLGANATAPNTAGPASGYVLHTDEGLVLVDAGPGTMAAFTSRYPLDAIRAFVVTHLHADHSLDLMAWAYRWTFPQVLPPLPLLVPEGATASVAAFDALFGIPTLSTMNAPVSQSFVLEAMPMDGTTSIRLPGAELVSFAARHAVPSAALRFRVGDRSYTFSSDTGDCPGLRDAARGADVFVCEATWLDEPAPEDRGHGHLTPAEAGTIAAESGVGTLVLTHLSRPEDGAESVRRARERFDGPIVLAAPGVRVA